jgi:hypothetical protein
MAQLPLGYQPKSPTGTGEAIEGIITTATEDFGDIFMIFISAHVQPLAHTEHGKNFTVSHLRVSSDIPRTPPTNIPAASPVATSWTSART